MDLVVDALSWILLTCGGLFVLTGGIGALRMREFYPRLHAASLTDSAGTILILLGTVLQAGFTLASFKLLAVLLFLLLTGPTATYALANAALVAGMRLDAAGNGPTSDEHAEPNPDEAR